MANIEVHEVINAQPEVVFPFIGEPERHLLWQSDIKSDELTSGDGGVGSVRRETRKVMGKSVTSEYEVTELNPPSRWGFRTLRGPITSEGAFACAPVDNGGSTATQVTLRLSFAGWAGEVMVRMAQKQFTEHLSALKALVEREGAKV